MIDQSKVIQGLMRCLSLSDEELYELIRFDIDNGVTFFDLADIYGNGEAEAKIGRVLAAHPELRERMFIQTKCSICRSIGGNYYDLSAQHIVEAVDDSLNRLGLGHIDALLLHRPDIFMDAKEVAKAFNELKNKGKVTYFGVSNFPKEAIKYLQSELEDKLEFNQVQLGLGHLDLIDEVFNFNMDNEEGKSKGDQTFLYMKRKGIRLQAWSPFMYGFFRGSIFDESLCPELNAKLNELAQKYRTSKCALASAFVLKLGDNVSIITGSMNKEHVKECLDGTNLDLSKEDWYALYRSSGKMVP